MELETHFPKCGSYTHWYSLHYCCLFDFSGEKTKTRGSQGEEIRKVEKKQYPYVISSFCCIFIPFSKNLCPQFLFGM